jgi:hypothetical protein
LDWDSFNDLSLSVRKNLCKSISIVDDILTIMLLSLLIVLLIITACLGYGMIALRLLGCQSAPSWAENWSRAFALGIGTLAWFLFWIGIMGGITSWILWTLLIPGWLSLWWTRGDFIFPSLSKFNRITYLLILLIFVSTIFDFLEALAPPADADTLAYHFSIPKLFLAEGRIEFVPIAVQGAIPLLFHLTYMLALGLGGEISLTLWTFSTQLFTTLAIYGVGKRWLSRNWSLALTLLFVLTPAVIYGGGSGHMEVRTSLFMLIGAMAVAEGVKTRNIGLIILAGLMAGFFMASKYYGLFASIGIGVVVLMQSRPFRPTLFFAVAALLSGFQWYGWNWWHTGIPVFPTLFHLMGTPVNPYWNETLHHLFKEAYSGFVCVSANPLWLLWYPFAATLFPESCFGPVRTGLGPFLWLLLPGVIAGFWRFRHQWNTSKLLLMLIPAFVYYLLWFLIPSNQMMRHILPVYSLLLIGATVIVKRLEEKHGILLLQTSMTICIIMGLGIHSLFGLNYFKYHVKSESREEFLARNVGYYNVVQWINANLPDNARIANPIRYLNYLIEKPYIYLNAESQALVETHKHSNLKKLLRQLDEQQITHIIISPSVELWKTSKNNLLDKLIYSKVILPIQSFDTYTYHSRTLGKSSRTSAGIIRLLQDNENNIN